MADDTAIINGSIDGYPISITGGSVDGGPKLSIKQFPNKDTQSIENLGLKPRSYSIDINVSEKPGQTYFEYRDGLLAVLESKREVVLIHPLYGRLENMVSGPFSLSENLGSFGDTTLTVTFDPSKNTGIPQSSGNAVTNVQSLNKAVTATVRADIEDNFSVDVQNTGNFQAAVDSVNDLIDQAKKSTEFIGEAAATLNEYAAEIGKLSADVNSLVSDPLKLSSALVSLFESTNGLYASADATFITFTGFFGFGSGALLGADTAALIERLKNNEVVNGSVAASSLGYAYLAAVQLDFQTTRDIDETAAQLDDQYNAVQSGGAAQSVKDAVTEMRITVLDVFDQARVDASQIITIETLPTSVRLLAFDYYGSDELGQTIADLNNISDVSFVEGSVEILTS